MLTSALATAIGTILPGASQPTDRVTIRGHEQTVRLFGTRGGVPVVLTSGDGGWVHLAPHVADVLAAHGCFVVGIDTRAYLESFTAGDTTLRPADEPGDFRTLAEFAGRGSAIPPVLVGVSEGAGLSVLAATDPATQSAIGGVIALGLPVINELGWRWRDAVIYVTHGIPHEPTFNTRDIVARVTPVPLAAIHSTHDEFVPLADIQSVMNAAGGPKRLWVIDAADHRFSDKQDEFDTRLIEALEWVRDARRR